MPHFLPLYHCGPAGLACILGLTDRPRYEKSQSGRPQTCRFPTFGRAASGGALASEPPRHSLSARVHTDTGKNQHGNPFLPRKNRVEPGGKIGWKQNVGKEQRRSKHKKKIMDSEIVTTQTDDKKTGENTRLSGNTGPAQPHLTPRHWSDATLCPENTH